MAQMERAFASLVRLATDDAQGDLEFSSDDHVIMRLQGMRKRILALDRLLIRGRSEQMEDLIRGMRELRTEVAGVQSELGTVKEALGLEVKGKGKGQSKGLDHSY